MAELDLALVFTPDPWVEELHRHLADHGGARVLHLVVDPTMARHEEFDVLVAGWRWPALTAGLVAELHEQGRGVLGVADREERGARGLLEQCGVDAIVEADAAPWEFVEALATIEVARLARGGREAANGPRRDDGGMVRRAHPWIAVCGPAGAGRTEVAIELARALGAVLVDADEVAPAVAARLGLALEPNVRTAVDAVELGVGDATSSLQRVDGLRCGVLCGLPHGAAWLHVRATELVRVLHACSNRAPVVIDTSAALDDVGGPVRGRYAVTRAVVADADVVVAVGLANPLGVVRLLGWLAEAQRLRPAPAGPVHVLLNRSDGAPFRRAGLSNELLRSYRSASLDHAPDDARVRAAGWNGALVARGPFTKAVGAVAARIERATTEAVAS